jgi:hypothetical protein
VKRAVALLCSILGWKDNEPAMKIRGRIPPALWLAGMAAVGLLLMFLPTNVPQWSAHDFGISRDVGIAVLSASILGFTIDRWLKAEIVSDVFEAAIGHVLPKEFRQEIQHIISHKFICEKHAMIVDIADRGDGTVRVTTSIERTSRNISAYPEAIPALIHLYDWGFDEASKILDCQITVEGFAPVKSEPEVTHPDGSISAETAKVNVGPGQTAKVYLKGTQIRRMNDDISWIFLAPTIKPEIEVQLSPSLAYRCGFGTPAETVENSQIANRHQLNGTYFPGQRMRVRWWPKVLAGKTDSKLDVK